jgi:predicted alpha/beta superfamily hydrolase
MAPAFTIKSPQTGTEYWIFVEAPDPAREPGPWPAVAFMDGDNLFQFAADGYRQARAARELPPILLLGVGYGAGVGKPRNKRLRDYTATAMATEKGSGGAEAFHSFLADTLWPELARRYPLRASARGLAGHSLGSLLVLHGLFRPQPFFTHYLAGAPSIWWDDRSVLAQVAHLRERQEELRARLYLGVGAEDTPSMTGDLTLLERQLKENPFAGLEIIPERFPGRNHYDVVPDEFRSGLRALFGPPEGSTARNEPAFQI